jgi:chaperonin GroES
MICWQAVRPTWKATNVDGHRPVDPAMTSTRFLEPFYQLSFGMERKTMKLRPLHDRLVVKRLDNERKTASGIVIPDNAAEKPDQGEVMAVGNGKILEDGKVRALDVKVGDKVLFGKYSGQTVKVDGEELLVLREDDVMAVIA